MVDRVKVLREFHPGANEADWKLVDAGIRVQAIKRTDGEAGIVHYGTDVLTSADRTMAALLGASSGASTSVHIVLQANRTCLPHLLAGDRGLARIRSLIPTYGIDLRPATQADQYAELATPASATLRLTAAGQPERTGSQEFDFVHFKT